MVIAIIGVLVGLLLPGVQAARESARNAICKNNVEQLAKAVLNYQGQYMAFPSGGWGNKWAGDQTLGIGAKQPGGWTYSVLPYMDQMNLYQQSDVSGRLNTPLAIHLCPTRRPIQAFPPGTGATFVNATPQAGLGWGRTDYAANAGDTGVNADPGPATAAAAITTNYVTSFASTGVIYQYSQITPAHIVDGASNTYLLGEKYMNIDHRADGADPGDVRPLYVGFDSCNERIASTTVTPLQDASNSDSSPLSTQTFGGPHSGAFNMAFCDGSVHPIAYGIDPDTHHRLANRADRQPVDPTKY